MSASSLVSVIVVGCGKWGRKLVVNAIQLKCLAAVVDKSSEAIASVLEHIPALSSIPTYTSLETALDFHPNAAVVVATPPSSHFDLATHAIHANRSVFVEKPMCTSFRLAQTLVDLACSNGVTLMTDHLLQYSLPHRRLIHLTRTGFVGDVHRIRMIRNNFGTIRTGENVLWSFTPHDISILLSLLPNHDIQNATVSCRGQALITSSIEDYVDISISLGKVCAQIEASWLHPFRERRVVVYGNQGAVVLNESMPDASLPKLQAFKWTTKRSADGSAVAASKIPTDVSDHLYLHNAESECSFSDELDPLQAALKHFIHCASTGALPRTDGNEALRVLAILETASKSLQRGGEAVKVSDVCSYVKIEENMREPDSPKLSSIHPSAIVDNGATIGLGTRIWHFCHIMSGAFIGNECNLGQNVYVGATVVLGNNVKVQNNVSIYDAVTVADNVFLGPSCVFTNVKNPRASISRKHAFSKTKVEQGATVGANATIVCGVTLGEFCLVGAGAVVTKDVPAHALVYGNPAKIHGWASTSGTRLQIKMRGNDGTVSMTCPETHQTYTLYENGIDGVPGPTLVQKKKIMATPHNH